MRRHRYFSLCVFESDSQYEYKGNAESATIRVCEAESTEYNESRNNRKKSSRTINDKVHDTQFDKFEARGHSLTNRGFEMLELREAQRLSGGRDAIIVPIKVVADRVDRAPDVHLRHGGNPDAKLEVAPVTCLESTLLTFAHLVLIICVNDIRIHEAHQ